MGRIAPLRARVQDACARAGRGLFAHGQHHERGAGSCPFLRCRPAEDRCAAVRQDHRRADPWPEARFVGSFHAIGKGKALLYGGYAGSGRGVFGDLWELDLKTGKWKKLPSPPAPNAAAASLWNPAIGRLVVLNGIERGDTSSVRLYDPASGKWEVAGQTGIAKSYVASACDPKSGDVYLLGGVVGGFFGKHAPDRLVRVSFAKKSAQ